MARVHKNIREGMYSRFTNESKFWKDDIIAKKIAVEAKQEGDLLRNKLSGKRILLDLRDRDLKNAYRL